MPTGNASALTTAHATRNRRANPRARKLPATASEVVMIGAYRRQFRTRRSRYRRRSSVHCPVRRSIASSEVSPGSRAGPTRHARIPPRTMAAPPPRAARTRPASARAADGCPLGADATVPPRPRGGRDEHGDRNQEELRVREAPTAQEQSRGDGSAPRAAGEGRRRGEERRDEREVREVAAAQEGGPCACQDRPGEPREPGCLAAAARQRGRGQRARRHQRVLHPGDGGHQPDPERARDRSG